MGLQEQFDACLPQFFDALGAEPIEVSAVNINSDKAPSVRYELEPQVRAEIDDLNSIDRDLYEAARRRLVLPVG